MSQGLLIVNTGDGKGKTTAALGLALRAAGHGQQVCFIQFIKGSWVYGELHAVKKLADTIALHVMGRGFTWKSEDLARDRELARQAWDFAQSAIAGGRYQIVVLDEFTYLFTHRFLEIEPVIQTLTARPPAVHVVITGRGAPAELIAAADLVTEMRAVKHPFQAGIKAQKGIEF